MNARAAARRPGGRTAETTARIFDATLDLLMQGGTAACGFQAVAERAEVARATLYRRWPTRAALVADALAERLGSVIAVPDAGSFAADLRGLLGNLAAFLQTPLGRAAIAAAAELEPDLAAERAGFWPARHAAVAPLFDRAVARGELPAQADREALLAGAAGALYFRLLVAAEPLDDAWLDRIVRLIAPAAGAR